MPGGTWRILVEEGQAAEPTQSTIASSQVQTKSKEKTKAQKASEESKRMFNRTSAVLGFSAGIAVNGFNQYYSITGQTGKKNRMNAGLTYGGIAATAAINLASGNMFGLATTVAAGGVLLGNQVLNFGKEIAEQNANAEYLRLRSNTSVLNGKDLYSFSLR